MSMNRVYKVPNLESIAIAKLFACGGSQKLWEKSYFGIIQKYAKKFPKVKIGIYMKEFSDVIKKKIHVPTW